MTVYLVGAGPGDPDLLTLRGARLLERAQVVIHDRLASPVLALANSGALLVDVGKTPGGHAIDQDQIDRLLVHYGLRYPCVVRLKGGDPLVFAHGAEELSALREAGIEAEVVPGISAVLAAPAAAGVPLTLRSIASSFTVLTGHEDPEAVPVERWRALADVGGTIAILMASRTIAAIAAKLIAAGMPPTTPVVAIRSATRPDEVVARSTLEGVERLALGAPVVFVVGEAARFDAPARPASADVSHPLAKIEPWRAPSTRDDGRGGLRGRRGRRGWRPEVGRRPVAAVPNHAPARVSTTSFTEPSTPGPRNGTISTS